jgi:hypothetical protein
MPSTPRPARAGAPHASPASPPLAAGPSSLPLAHLSALSRLISKWPEVNAALVSRVAAATNAILACGYESEAFLPGEGMAGVEGRRREADAGRREAFGSACEAGHTLLRLYLDIKAAAQSVQSALDAAATDCLLAGAEEGRAGEEGQRGAAAALPDPSPLLPLRRAERAADLLAELLELHAAELAVKQAVLARLRPGSLPVAAESDREHLTLLASAVAGEPFRDGCPPGVGRREELMDALAFVVGGAGDARAPGSAGGKGRGKG